MAGAHMRQESVVGVSGAAGVAAVAAIAAVAVGDYMFAAAVVAADMLEAVLVELVPDPVLGLGYDAADSSHNSADVLEAHHQAAFLPI